MMKNQVFVYIPMNKIYATCIVGAMAWCAAAQASSPRLDGEPTFCPPFDDDFPDPKPIVKPKPLIPKEELRGEIDIYDPMHWHSINQMFIRNARKTKIEKNMTQPEDAINKALAEFNYGSNGSSESKELLQLSSNGDQ